MNYEVLQPPPETTVAEESCFDPQQQMQHPFLALPAPPNSEIEFLKRCDKFKAVYSELLYRWQLLVKVGWGEKLRGSLLILFLLQILDFISTVFKRD